MSDTSNVTTLALLNLIRLLAGELVAGEHRDDFGRLIQAMDRHLDGTPLPRGTDVNDAREGIRKARDLLRPYVGRVRELADAVHARDQAAASSSLESKARPLSPSSKYLQ